MKSFKTRLQEMRMDTRTGRYRPAKHKAEYEDEGEYDNLVVVLENKFRDRLEALFGMEDHPKRTLLYSLVSDYG